MEIFYDADFPPELKTLIEEILAKYAWLCPLWLQELEIGWYSDERESTAEMSVLSDYRSAKMWIYPRFLNCTRPKQFEAVVHELVHCFNVPLKTACLNALEDVAPDVDEKIKAMARRAINKEMERITQDFAFSIVKKFNA